MTLCQNSAPGTSFQNYSAPSGLLFTSSPGSSFQNYSAPSGLVKIVRSKQGAAPLRGLKHRTSSVVSQAIFYPLPFILYPCLYPCPFFSLFQNLICPVHRLIGCFYQLILLNCCIFRYLYHTFTLKITKYLYYRVFIY